MKFMIISPNEKIYVCNDVTWVLTPYTKEDLLKARAAGVYVNEYAYSHARYAAKRLDTNDEYWVSYFYKRDINDYMKFFGLA
jgi:hypothetical protein